MENKSIFKTTGLLFIFAAITFWTAWFLMPDQGTADTLHILTIVRQTRDSVFCSAIIQIISSVAFIPALFFLGLNLPGSKSITVWGLILFAIGAMGMCMDAFFHLFAFYMTDPIITIQSDIVNLMEFVQTKGVIVLVPLLLPFFIGTLLLTIGLSKQLVISRTSSLICFAALTIGIIGGVLVNVLGYGRPTLGISVLAMFALAQIIMGIGLIKKA